MVRDASHYKVSKTTILKLVDRIKNSETRCVLLNALSVRLLNENNQLKKAAHFHAERCKRLQKDKNARTECTFKPVQGP